MKVTGAQAIVNCLLEQGVDTIFGYPGGAVIPLYDALYDSPLKCVLPVHEQGAIHAADGYARASGRTGVCIATSGPGAANIVTGLATAYMDSVPIVAITGQVSTSQLGRDAFQEIDIVSVTLAMTKHSFLVTDVKKLPEIIRSAFAIAAAGRPGPVLIDIPSNIQTAELDYLSETVSIECDKSDLSLAPEVLNGILRSKEVLKTANRPVLLVGGGVVGSNISQTVQAFAEKLAIPVVSTLMGLGSLPSSHSQFLGLTGMHGHVPANKVIALADTIIAIGTRFSDRTTGDRTRYGSDKTIIHIEIDPAEIDKNIPAHIPLVGDLGLIVSRITKEVEGQSYSEWWETIRNWQNNYELDYNLEEMTAPWVMHFVSSRMKDESAVFVTDVGQNQLWAAQHLNIYHPRSWLTSGGCGTMGFGLPAALGAQMAVPEKRVVHIAGDGGFKMTGMELFTAVNEKLPIISIVLNNQSLGMVRQWQQLFYNARYSSTYLPEFDFVAFARSCGAEGAAVNTQQEFKLIFEEALKNKKPFVIVVNIHREDMVTPMIAPGATLDDYVKV